MKGYDVALTRRIKNNTGSARFWAGQKIEPGAYYEITLEELLTWGEDSEVAADILSGDLVVNDGLADITDTDEADRLLRKFSASWLAMKPLALDVDTPADKATLVFDAASDEWHVTNAGAASEVSSTTLVSTTSSTYQLISGMSATPESGTYLVSFSCWGNGTNTAQEKRISIYSDGSIVNHSVRQADGDMGNGQRQYDIPFHSQALLTVNGSQTIEARFSTSTGTFRITERSLILLRVT